MEKILFPRLSIFSPPCRSGNSTTKPHSAFDVTPTRYITKIITEKGIVKANKEEIKKLFDNVSD